MRRLQPDVNGEVSTSKADQTRLITFFFCHSEDIMMDSDCIAVGSSPRPGMEKRTRTEIVCS